MFCLDQYSSVIFWYPVIRILIPTQKLAHTRKPRKTNLVYIFEIVSTKFGIQMAPNFSVVF